MLAHIALGLLAGSSAVLATPRVSVKLDGAQKVNGVKSLKITANITNTGDETLRLLNDPNSLLTPKWATNVFDITSAKGQKPEFKGVAVKYAPKIDAGNKNYAVLEPGESLAVSHPVAGVYNFKPGSADTYEIKPSALGGKFTHVTKSGELITLVAGVGDVHKLLLFGNLVTRTPMRTELGEDEISKRANRYNGCSSTQQSHIAQAAKDAQTYADNTYKYVVGISSSTTRYKEWFGIYDSKRKTIVQNHYNNIRNGQLASDSFDCTCTESGTYAYVYPDTFGYIYLCGAFWSAPATGTDSKAGTLVHESSHFTNNGGTEDYYYGQVGCRILAEDNPSEAVMNAAHEYFAENNPALP